MQANTSTFALSPINQEELEITTIAYTPYEEEQEIDLTGNQDDELPTINLEEESKYIDLALQASEEYLVYENLI